MANNECFFSDVHPKSRVFYYFSSEYGTTSVIQYTDIWVLLRLGTDKRMSSKSKKTNTLVEKKSELKESTRSRIFDTVVELKCAWYETILLPE